MGSLESIGRKLAPNEESPNLPGSLLVSASESTRPISQTARAPENDSLIIAISTKALSEAPPKFT